MKTVSIVITALAFLMAMTIITGFVYPLLMTGFGQLVFPFQANGSLLKDGKLLRGSRLLAQEFSSDRFFHGRPSAGSYNTVPSGASNLSPPGKALKVAVDGRKGEWIKQFGNGTIPNEMLFSSASGLDPDIGIDAALAQADRISKARIFSHEQESYLKDFIKNNPEGHETFPAIPRANIMDLNNELETDPMLKVK
jgi:K+-transporting ATPase ATPase C chain